MSWKILLGRGHKVQGRDRAQLAYYSPLQPGLAIWGVLWTSIFILVSGYQVFFTWNTQNFLTAYINIPIFIALWVGWSVYMRTPFWRAHEMDFVTVRCCCSRTFIVPDVIDVGSLARTIPRASRLSKRPTPRKYLRVTWARRSATPCSEWPVETFRHRSHFKCHHQLVYQSNCCSIYIMRLHLSCYDTISK